MTLTNTSVSIGLRYNLSRNETLSLIGRAPPLCNRFAGRVFTSVQKAHRHRLSARAGPLAALYRELFGGAADTARHPGCEQKQTASPLLPGSGVSEAASL